MKRKENKWKCKHVGNFKYVLVKKYIVWFSFHLKDNESSIGENI